MRDPLARTPPDPYVRAELEAAVAALEAAFQRGHEWETAVAADVVRRHVELAKWAFVATLRRVGRVTEAQAIIIGELLDCDPLHGGTMDVAPVDHGKVVRIARADWLDARELRETALRSMVGHLIVHDDQSTELGRTEWRTRRTDRAMQISPDVIEPDAWPEDMNKEKRKYRTTAVLWALAAFLMRTELTSHEPRVGDEIDFEVSVKASDPREVVLLYTRRGVTKGRLRLLITVRRNPDDPEDLTVIGIADAP